MIVAALKLIGLFLSYAVPILVAFVLGVGVGILGSTVEPNEEEGI